MTEKPFEGINGSVSMFQLVRGQNVSTQGNLASTPGDTSRPKNDAFLLFWRAVISGAVHALWSLLAKPLSATAANESTASGRKRGAAGGSFRV